MKHIKNFKSRRENNPPVRVRLSAADNPIDIRKDNVFKAVFTQNTPASQGALSKLVSALIGREISIIAIAPNEPAVENTHDRQIRFDISCKAENGELVNVEMSINPDRSEPERLEFYTGKLLISQDIRGAERDYNDLQPAYQIAILAKNRFFDDDEVLHTFEYYDPVHGMSLNGKSRIITLELSKFNEIIMKPAEGMSAAERWGSFFRYLTNKAKRGKINEIIACEEGIAMASEVLLCISRDEVERARQLSEYKYELDTQSRIVGALRKGERRGRRKGRLEIIELLKSGKPPEEIIREHGG